jgi:hypothetical protein
MWTSVALEQLAQDAILRNAQESTIRGGGHPFPGPEHRRKYCNLQLRQRSISQPSPSPDTDRILTLRQRSAKYSHSSSSKKFRLLARTFTILEAMAIS